MILSISKKYSHLSNFIKHDQSNKNYSLSKDLLQASSLLIIVVGFFLWQMYLMMFQSSKDDTQERQQSLESAESKVRRAIRQELRFYAKTGDFSTNPNKYLNEYEKNSNKYLLKINAKSNQLVMSVVYFHNSVSYSAFGVIKIISSTPKLKTYQKGAWQHLETLSFVCNHKEPGTPLQSEIDIASLNDECPNGYTQTFKKQKDLAELL